MKVMQHTYSIHPICGVTITGFHYASSETVNRERLELIIENIKEGDFETEIERVKALLKYEGALKFLLENDMGYPKYTYSIDESGGVTIVYFARRSITLNQKELESAIARIQTDSYATEKLKMYEDALTFLLENKELEEKHETL